MDAQVEIQLLPTSELTEHVHGAIQSLEHRVDWGAQPDGRVLVWAHSTWAVILQVDGQLASHVGIVDREVLLDGRAIRIAGIASVMTEPELQGRGYATAALRLATGFIHDSLRVPFALLLCLEHRRTLYEGLGWQPVPGPVFCDQPDGKVLLTIPGRDIMFLPGTSEEVPVGPIDLCGLPW